ncbi:uncharacterized protein BT62DRAFT_900496, partial [Guyanagaster necrorhizus]
LHAPLFLCENGDIPSQNWFDKKFFAILGRDFGGHSTRAGEAMFYALLRLSESIIQALGQWSSKI